MSSSRPRARARPPLRVQVLVWAVAAVATAALAGAAWAARAPSGRDAVVAALLAVMVGVAHRFPVQVGPRLQVSSDTAPAFAAALLLPLHLAMAVSILGIGAGEVARHNAPVQTVYNVAVAALRALAAAISFIALRPAPLADQPGSWQIIAALLAAALAMYASNVVLIDAVVALQRGVNPLRGWLSRRRSQAAHEASLYLLGVLVAAVAARWPPALVLLAAPSVAVYRSLRDGAALRLQSRQALEELADVIDARDGFAAGHSQRVAELAHAVARRLDLSPEEVELVTLAARVHDVGAAGVPTTVLAKQGPLTAAEWSAIRAHAETGARLLGRFPALAGPGALVLAHHERWDGRGYPRGLRGEAIPLGARVIAVADAWEAMTSPRPYRPALTAETARAELRSGRGSQFDPRVIDALLTVLDSTPEFVPRRGGLPSEGALQLR